MQLDYENNSHEEKTQKMSNVLNISYFFETIVKLRPENYYCNIFI